MTEPQQGPAPPDWRTVGDEQDELRTPEDQVRHALAEYDAMEKPLEGGLVVIIRAEPEKEEVFLSGNPYLWSAFHDRAFAFANQEDARKLIERFPEQLRHCRVHEYPAREGP